jgi:spermidine synthase
VNRYFRMGGGAAFGERRMGHLPLLFAPGARTALYLGVATGSTLGAVRSFPLARVDAVELVPAILDFLPLFEHLSAGVHRDPRVHFHAADARRWVAATPASFDVVVADLFHPARDGAGSLYAREHFETVRAHLAPGGLFAQWLPLYQLDPGTLKTIVRTFLAAFPQVHSMLGIYNAETPALVLLGGAPEGPGGSGATTARIQVALEALESQLARPVYGELQMQDPRDLLGGYMLDREALAAYAGRGPENTDLHPRVLFDAPQSVYANRPELRYESLASLLPRRTPYPELLVTAADRERLAAFRAGALRFSAALGHYLDGEVRRAAAGGEAVPAAVESYLLAYETEPAFPAAAAILRYLVEAEAGAPEPILRRMLARTPDRPELYRLRLRHFARTGQRERFEALLAEARSRFGSGDFPASLSPAAD